MKPAKIEIIDPKSRADRALDLKDPVFDAKTIEHVDLYLETLEHEFEQWLGEDMARLQSARLAAAQGDWSSELLAPLFVAAHDIKGLGSTYGFPIITEICASLCRLIETDAGKRAAQTRPHLIEAHVDAARAAARDGMRDAAHPIGRALINALDAQVQALGVAPR